MAKINIVIADNDLDYLEEISKFLSINFSQKLQLSSFSNNDELLSYMNNEQKKIDVLLISPNLYSDNIKKDMFGIVIILTAGLSLSKNSNFKYINKYQKASDIFNKIISIYSEHSKETLFSGIISKETKIVAVYSASGGAGKSTVSIASSIYLSMKGLKVLYLNFETFQSTQHYFTGGSDKNLSNLFYFMKNEKNKLALKMEETRNIDIKTGVHYFSPPDSALEIAELESEEIKYFLNQIREKSIYDVVFVDLSTELNKRNVELLNEADDIFLVFTSDITSITKLRLLMQQLETLKDNNENKIFDKLRFIENKFIERTRAENNNYKDDKFENAKTAGIKIGNSELLFCIPFIELFHSNPGNENIFGVNFEFDEAIGKLNERFIKGVTDGN
ncbi:MAG: AAA family ATPase [Clostridia bacterium]|jgi:cellulose biosynthesis protein BcsQ